MSNGDRSIANLHPELAALQQYRFRQQLGAGGMSLVYQAENPNMGQWKEALKILNDSQLRQPNIVTAINSMRLPSPTVFAMQYSLERKTVHRDIKPPNLMLTKVGTKNMVKVLDFPIARRWTSSYRLGETAICRGERLRGAGWYVRTANVAR